jgi:hypothetical protein
MSGKLKTEKPNDSKFGPFCSPPSPKVNDFDVLSIIKATGHVNPVYKVMMTQKVLL